MLGCDWVAGARQPSIGSALQQIHAMRGYDGPVRVHPLLETSVSPAPHAAPL